MSSVGFTLPFILALNWLGPSSDASLQIGQQPPAPKTVAFRGPALTQFKPGVCYLLEFWGTWCAPCRTAIPHLNDLVRSQVGKGVEFYSIAIADTPGDLERFLKRNELRTNIVLDDHSATSNAYNIHVVPRTVLIDANGNVAAVTDPDRVTPELVSKLIAGMRLDLPMANLKTADFDWTRKLPTTAKSYLWIEESDVASSGWRFPPGSGEMSGDGLFAQGIVSLAYDADFFHTDWRAKNVDNVMYRIAVKAPLPDDALVREMVRPLLGPLFGLSARWEDQDKEVYVLSQDSAKTVHLDPPGPAANNAARGGQINWANATSGKIAELIGNFCLHALVVDESGLGARRFALKVKWIPGDETSAIKAIEELGFRLVKGIRKVKMLIVESVSK